MTYYLSRNHTVLEQDNNNIIRRTYKYLNIRNKKMHMEIKIHISDYMNMDSKKLHKCSYCLFFLL